MTSETASQPSTWAYEAISLPWSSIHCADVSWFLRTSSSALIFYCNGSEARLAPWYVMARKRSSALFTSVYNFFPSPRLSTRILAGKRWLEIVPCMTIIFGFFRWHIERTTASPQCFCSRSVSAKLRCDCSIIVLSHHQVVAELPLSFLAFSRTCWSYDIDLTFVNLERVKLWRLYGLWNSRGCLNFDLVCCLWDCLAWLPGRQGTLLRLVTAQLAPQHVYSHDTIFTQLLCEELNIFESLCHLL